MGAPKRRRRKKKYFKKKNVLLNNPNAEDVRCADDSIFEIPKHTFLKWPHVFKSTFSCFNCAAVQYSIATANNKPHSCTRSGFARLLYIQTFLNLLVVMFYLV